MNTPSYPRGQHHLVVVAALLAPTLATAASDPPPQQIQVTATRLFESVDTVPASVSIVTGAELRARGAMDLGTALALVGGVEAPAGGDAGPASAVPSFWGLHEFDAFLLVVDGIPWGGAFNPAISTLDLNNVERIEVLKGAAPVPFGATSFVGVIHVIHYPAGQSSQDATLGFGNYGSVRASGAIAVPETNGFRQSLAVSGEKLGFADDRERMKTGRLAYFANGNVGAGTLRFDAAVAGLRQTPPSPVVREGEALTTVTPRDANFNPADSAMDEDRYHFVLGYSLSFRGGTWDTTASYSHSSVTDIRGFIRPELEDTGDPNADSQRQHRTTKDFYADTHWSFPLSGNATFMVGMDMLLGRGKQSSENGEYYVPLTGRVLAPPTTDLHVDETNTLDDRRDFYGQYVQFQYRPDPDTSIVGGLRMSETREHKISQHLDGFDPNANEYGDDKRSTNRLGGMLGASRRFWKDGADHAVFYADYRNTFKPAALDFGPDFTPDVLKPETAVSYEAGVKGALAGGRLTYDFAVFYQKFKNLVLQTTNEEGEPVLQNAGGERLQGGEIETRYHVSNNLTLALNGAYHNAKFTEGVASEGDEEINLAGKHLTLSPKWLASSGFIYASGPVSATGTLRYVGRRFLDLANEAPTGGYTAFDAGVGYRFSKRVSVSLNGYNLSGKRVPVTQSEFGSSSYYLLPARRYFLDLRCAL